MDSVFPCCLDEETRASLRVSKEIERELERWKKDSSKEYKLLLLGEQRKLTFYTLRHFQNQGTDTYNGYPGLATLTVQKVMDQNTNKGIVKVCELCVFVTCPGTGEAGKSTFIKQMRIIHGAGYTQKDRAEFKELVYKNIYTAVTILVEAMRVLKIPYEVPSNQVSPYLINSWLKHWLAIVHTDRWRVFSESSRVRNSYYYACSKRKNC